MHIVFGMVVVPYLLDVAIELDDKLKKAFEFIKKMENSGDAKIAEVVEFSILENLIGIDNSKIKILVEYRDSETLKALDDIKKWYNYVVIFHQLENYQNEL